MTDAPAALPPAPSPSSALAGTAPVTQVSPTTQAAQVERVVAATQAALASAVNLSPQAQQRIRAEAFQQLVSSLVQHLPQASVQLPANWPTSGVPAALQQLLNSMIAGGSATQALPQQLLTVQAWPQSLLQAVLQQAGQPVGQQVEQQTGEQTGLSRPPGQALLPPMADTRISTSNSSPQPTQTLAQTPAASAAPATPATPATPTATVRPAIPALQTWLVLQGHIQAQDGMRSFSMTLHVPQAWAQAQLALSSALPSALSNTLPSASANASAAGAHPPGAAANPLAHPGAAAGAQPGLATGALGLAGLQLNFAGTMQQLSSAAFGIVLQPQALPGSAQAAQAQLQTLRTSAILQLEMQPLAPAAQAAQPAIQAAAAFGLAQEWQALLLQTRPTDPWLLMAQQQAEGQQPRQPTYASEEAGICTVLGCQYMGRAICAQPFCSEMNYLWSVARLQGRIDILPSLKEGDSYGARRRRIA